MEDSVPIDEKFKARLLIKDKLKYIREHVYSKRVVITPRTNGPSTGMMEADVKGVLTKETVQYI